MKVLEYIVSSFRELKTETTWLSKEEAQQSTMIVAVFTILFALAVFAIDQVFQKGLEAFFNIL